MDFSSRDIEKYINAYSSEEDHLLIELDRQTNLRVVQPRMLSGHIQGKFLEILTKMFAPRHVLEIGTFTGYLTLCIAAGLDAEATIDTFEVDDELEPLFAGFFKESSHSEKITSHIGSVLEGAPGLGRVFDLVFMDGDKREYPDYYRMLMGDSPYNKPLTKSGSVIIADNILWSGKVVEQVKHNDKHTQAILKFNDIVKQDQRVENVILPLRDGLNIIRVK